MKKIFILCLMALVMCVNANAQNWEVDYHQADDLKGTEGYYSNYYRDTNGNYFVCWSNDTDVKIGAHRGIFDYDDNYVFVIIGFYQNGSLIEKETSYFYVPRGDSDTAYTNYKSPNLGAKIINHLRNVGNVRIIARKYSGADFDIVIPMNSNLK
jgi:hypothetical protein